MIVDSSALVVGEDFSKTDLPRACPASVLSSFACLMDTAPVILFDGVCNLCNGFVNFVIDRDPDARFRFGALQSKAGRDLATSVGIPVEAVDGVESIVLVDGGRGYTRSKAVLRIARHLGAPWSWSYGLMLMPQMIRDAVYVLMANHRYRWFGRRATCRVPTPELRARFLDHA